MNWSPRTGVSTKNLSVHVDDLVSDYKATGLISLKSLYADHDAVAELCTLLSPHLKWHHYVDDTTFMAWPYKQDHDGRIGVVSDQGRNEPDVTLIEWHIEGVSMQYPQWGGAWNMYNFKAPPNSGSTGFVDMAGLYNDLSVDERKFLDSAEIIHFCNWTIPPTEEQFGKFMDSVSQGKRIIYSKDGDEYVASFSRPAVERHPAFGMSTLRTCPCHNSFGLQEHLLLVGGRIPSDGERDFFAKTMDKIRWEISENEERQHWYFWDEGDLLIVDLFRLAHGVRAGYEKGQRNFQGYWLFEPGVPEEPSPRLLSLPDDIG